MRAFIYGALYLLAALFCVLGATATGVLLVVAVKLDEIQTHVKRLAEAEEASLKAWIETNER